MSRIPIDIDHKFDLRVTPTDVHSMYKATDVICSNDTRCGAWLLRLWTISIMIGQCFLTDVRDWIDSATDRYVIVYMLNCFLAVVVISVGSWGLLFDIWMMFNLDPTPPWHHYIQSRTTIHLNQKNSTILMFEQTICNKWPIVRAQILDILFNDIF